MKLLYFIPALFNSGGMERVLTEKVNYLIRNYNYDITIVTTEQLGRPCFYELDSKIKRIDLDIDFVSHYNRGLVSKSYHHLKKLKVYKKAVEKIIDEIKPDICISLFNKEIEFLSSLRDNSIKIAEIHFSKHFREQFLLSRKSGFIWKWVGKIRTRQMIRSTRGLDKLVVLTKADEKDWLTTNDNIIQIYNPSPLATDKIADIHSKNIIAVGRLDAQKGFDYITDAWKIVAEKQPGWKLDIFGDGEWLDFLSNKISFNGLNDSITLRGATKNIREEYLSHSFFVSSSRYEGFPMTMIEAVSCGLPCVSFDCHWGPNEIIAEGVNGFLVPVGDIELLAGKICTLIEDETLRQGMSLNSKTISLNFTKEKIMQEWVCLFDDLSNKNK